MEKRTYAERCASDPLYKQKRSKYRASYAQTARGKVVQQNADAKRRKLHLEEVKVKIRESVSKWRKDHPELNKSRTRDSHTEAKQQVLSHYGKGGLPNVAGRIVQSQIWTCSL